MEYTKKPRYLQ